jgi:hypothetical protein
VANRLVWGTIDTLRRLLLLILINMLTAALLRFGRRLLPLLLHLLLGPQAAFWAFVLMVVWHGFLLLVSSFDPVRSSRIYTKLFDGKWRPCTGRLALTGLPH